MDNSRQLQIIISARDEATKVINGVSSSFGDLVKSSEAGSLAFAGALTLTSKKIIDVASEMEQAKVSFDTFLGSSALASKTLKELSDTAKTTPFTFPTIVEAAKRLLAYGTEAEDLIPTIRMLGDISAGVGTDKLPQLILAFGQVKAATRLTGMELRQFSEAGVPLLGTLAKQAGVTAAQMQEMITDKAVGFDQVKKALESMTGEGGKFFNLMDKQSKTFSGRMSNISDQLIRVALNIAGISTNTENFGEVIKGGAFDQLSQGAQKVLDVLNVLEPKIKGFIDAFINNQAAIGAVMGLLVGGLLGAAVALAGFLVPLLALMAIGTAVGLVIGYVVAHFEELKPLLAAIGAMLVTLGLIILINVVPAFVAWAVAAGAAALATLIALAPVILVIAAVGVAVGLLALAWQKNWGGIQEKTQAFVEFLQTYVLPVVRTVFEGIKSIVKIVADDFIRRFENIRNVVEGVIGAINGIVNAARNMANSVKGGLKIPGFQHGGFVPGGFNEAVPAILHGGERVVPRNGVDVNNSGGGGSLTINFNGTVNVDNDQRMKQLAQTVIDMMGRQNELASKGVPI